MLQVEVFDKMVVVIAQLFTTGPFTHVVSEEDRLVVTVMGGPIQVTAVCQRRERRQGRHSVFAAQ